MPLTNCTPSVSAWAWGRNNSTNVKKVRWVLEELDLPYQQILAGLEFGLNHDPAYLAMNPNGLVPLLKDATTDAGMTTSAKA